MCNKGATLNIYSTTTMVEIERLLFQGPFLGCFRFTILLKISRKMLVWKIASFFEAISDNFRHSLASSFCHIFSEFIKSANFLVPFWAYFRSLKYLNISTIVDYIPCRYYLALSAQGPRTLKRALRAPKTWEGQNLWEGRDCLRVRLRGQAEGGRRGEGRAFREVNHRGTVKNKIK